jgi:hypothetical protein
MLTYATHVKLRRGILDFYFGNEQDRLGKEQNSKNLRSELSLFHDIGHLKSLIQHSKKPKLACSKAYMKAFKYVH